METVVLHTRLKAGKETVYDSEHRVIPPALDALLRQYGVKNWHIFRKNQDIFHIVECVNYANLLAAIKNHPVNVAWQAKMAELLEVTHDYSNPTENQLQLVWQL